jgi:hypothetical protein
LGDVLLCGSGTELRLTFRMLMQASVDVGSDEPVIGSSEVKRLEDRVRELERILGRKTLEKEILREALSKASSKN